MSLMRTFAMMLGEIDFLGTYVHSYHRKSESGRTLPYPTATFIILGIFMVFMPILLMNLLIGLAVGDIESVRRNAQLKRLAMQVRTNISMLSRQNLVLELCCNVKILYARAPV
jgi:transient receptor potential cation channel subfamily A protein 1